MMTTISRQRRRVPIWQFALLVLAVLVAGLFAAIIVGGMSDGAPPPVSDATLLDRFYTAKDLCFHSDDLLQKPADHALWCRIFDDTGVELIRRGYRWGGY